MFPFPPSDSETAAKWLPHKNIHPAPPPLTCDAAVSSALKHGEACFDIPTRKLIARIFRQSWCLLQLEQKTTGFKFCHLSLSNWKVCSFSGTVSFVFKETPFQRKSCCLEHRNFIDTAIEFYCNKNFIDTAPHLFQPGVPTPFSVSCFHGS